MSTIVVTHHNENIYNIIEQAVPAEVKPEKYISKFRKQVCVEEKKVKQTHKTFGYAVVPLPKPSEYLKKKCGIVPPRPEIDERRLLVERRPPIPSHPAVKKQHGKDEKKEKNKELKGGTWEAEWKGGKGTRCPCPKNESGEVKNQAKETGKREVVAPKPEEPEASHYDKNFRAQNVLKAIRSVPRQPLPKYADTRRGDFHPLESSGLIPKYIHKKTYGQMPAYLSHRLLEKEKKIQKQHDEVGNVKEEARYVSAQERKQLLEGLKHNWEEIQKAFQLLPMLTDTHPKVRRKQKLEDELRQLEHDIRTIERHKYIYVFNDSP